MTRALASWLVARIKIIMAVNELCTPEPMSTTPKCKARLTAKSWSRTSITAHALPAPAGAALMSAASSAALMYRKAGVRDIFVGGECAVKRRKKVG